MSAKMFRFKVTHPEFGEIIANGISPETAINAAIKSWGGDWRREAGYCKAVKLGTAAKPRCRSCHNEFGEPGDVTAYCPECLRRMEQRRREAARFGWKDRRAGVRE